MLVRHAFDVGSGERLAVMPFDALPKLEGEPGVVLVPRPALGKFRLDEFRPVLLLVLFEDYEIVEDAHRRRNRRDRCLLVYRHARRAVTVKEFKDPAALLGGDGTRRQPEGGEDQCRCRKSPQLETSLPG